MDKRELYNYIMMYINDTNDKTYKQSVMHRIFVYNIIVIHPNIWVPMSQNTKAVKLGCKV